MLSLFAPARKYKIALLALTPTLNITYLTVILPITLMLILTQTQNPNPNPNHNNFLKKRKWAPTLTITIFEKA